MYIKLVSPSDEETKNIHQILSPFENVIVYKNAEMSLPELQAYADKTAHELIDLGYEVTSWYVDSITGNIVISVLEKDYAEVVERISEISKNEDSPTIIIEIGMYVTVD